MISTVQVTAEHLADASGICRFHEEEPFQIPGTQRVLFFFLKRLMYVTEKGGARAHWGKNLL
jgi:hypothetical protein